MSRMPSSMSADIPEYVWGLTEYVGEPPEWVRGPTRVCPDYHSGMSESSLSMSAHIPEYILEVPEYVRGYTRVGVRTYRTMSRTYSPAFQKELSAPRRQFSHSE